MVSTSKDDERERGTGGKIMADVKELSDEALEKVHQAKTGCRRVLAPSAGRTSLGIMGNGFPENVCASSGSST